MEKIAKRLKVTNLLGIIACIVTYLLAFAPFDKGAVVSKYDDYEFYTQYLILGMCAVGLMTTFFMIGYISIQRGKSKSEASTNIYIGIINIAVSLVGTWTGNELVKATVFEHEKTYVEKTSNFYAQCYLIMIYVLILISVVHTINAIVCKIKEANVLQQEVITAQTMMNKKNRIAIMPIIVASITVLCSVIGTVCHYMIAIYVCLIPYIIAFALPVCVWFCVVVSKWESERKYKNVVASYLAYMLVVYGVMHTLFSQPISWLRSYTVLADIASPLVMGIICMVAGLVGLVFILVKSVQASGKSVTAE